MESFSQKWVVVALLDDVPEGEEFDRTGWPLHMTLAGVFESELTGKELAEKLTRMLEGQRVVTIEATERAQFGPGAEVAVMKIRKSKDLMQVYERIHMWLESLGVIYNSPQYEGDGYLPHSTLQKADKLVVGEQRLLRSVSLVDMFPGGDGYKRRVFKTITLT